MIAAPTPDVMARAVALLRAGELVGMPTETVYGLAADACNAAAVAKIFAVKERPSFNPLIIHAAELATLEQHGDFSGKAYDLATKFWPGPLTILMPKFEHSSIAPIARAGLPTLAARIPAHPVALELLKMFAKEGSGLIAAPSANKSESLSPTTPAHVQESLGDAVPLILAGGKCLVGVESTVIDLSGDTPRVLRIGGIAVEDIERVIGKVDYAKPGDRVVAPGMMLRHYAPSKPVRLDVLQAEADEGFLMFGPVMRPGGKLALNLSESGDVNEAAANLFDYLHRLQNADVTRIAVMPIPSHGLGAAINDRLRRASVPPSA